MLERTKEGRDTVLLMLYAAVIDDAEDMLRFERIYYGYRKQMFYVANVILSDEYDAEDAVQNALLGIARNIKALPECDDALIKAYVLTAAKNAALNLLPKKQRRDSELDIDELDFADGNGVFEKVAMSDDYKKLMKAIDKLPDMYRDVLLMHCVYGLKAHETAQLLGRKASTVRQQVTRGRKKLIEFCIQEGMVFDD